MTRKLAQLLPAERGQMVGTCAMSDTDRYLRVVRLIGATADCAD
jgi:hypothetical protein